MVAVLPQLAFPYSGVITGVRERVFLGLELVGIVVAATPLLRRPGYVPRDEAELPQADRLAVRLLGTRIGATASTLVGALAGSLCERPEVSQQTLRIRLQIR